MPWGRFDTSRAFTSHRSRAGGAPGKAKVERPSAKIPMPASWVVGKLKYTKPKEAAKRASSRMSLSQVYIQVAGVGS